MTYMAATTSSPTGETMTKPHVPTAQEFDRAMILVRDLSEHIYAIDRNRKISGHSPREMALLDRSQIMCEKFADRAPV